MQSLNFDFYFLITEVTWYIVTFCDFFRKFSKNITKLEIFGNFPKNTTKLQIFGKHYKTRHFRKTFQNSKAS